MRLQVVKIAGTKMEHLRASESSRTNLTNIPLSVCSPEVRMTRSHECNCGEHYVRRFLS